MATSLLGRAATVALMAATLAGCATGTMGAAPKNVDVVSQGTPDGLDPIATAAFWGTRYDRNPTDPIAAVNYSKALRTIENNNEALRVMQQASTRIPDDAEVMLELGKAFISTERAHEAVRPIETAIARGKSQDWSAYSAYGVALDMIGEHRQAQAQYNRALQLAPNKAAVLNNKGLSYALQGRRQMAESTLREASGEGGTAQIRQNYALVLAMGGKTAQAERLARSDLPPAVANGNIAYFRQLVAAPAYWGELDNANLDLPDFGDDPATISLAPREQPVPEPVPSPTPHLIKKPKPAATTPVPKVIDGAPAPAVTPKTNDQSTVSASTKPSDTVVVADASSGPLILEFDE